MCDFEDTEIIAVYPQKMGDWLDKYFKLCDIRFGTGIKSLVATPHLFSKIGRDQVMKIWDEYVIWRRTIMPKLKEEDQMFVTKINNKRSG